MNVNRRQFIRSHSFHFIAIAVLSALLLFSNLHIGGLSGYDDAFYAHEAKEMLKTNDWFNIRSNGRLNFEFPPLFIWIEAISFETLGVTDFAAKFPVALMGLLTILLVFLLARELSDDFWFPVLSAYILLLTQYFLKYSTHAMTDVPYTFFFTLAIFFYLKGIKDPKYLVFIGFAISSAVLTRTILGFIPLGVIFAHIILTARFRLLRSGYLLAAVVISVAIPAIWYVPQYNAYGNEFLAKHFAFIFSKVSTEGQTLSTFLIELAEYPWLLLKMYQPWFLVLLVGLWINGKNAIRKHSERSILLLLWFGFVLLPFSLADAKVLRYIMPIFPACAMLCATPLVGLIDKVKNKRYLQAGFVAVCLIVGLSAIFPNPRFRAKDMIKLSESVDKYTPENKRILMYTSGNNDYNYVSQLLWYSNRYSEHITEMSQLRKKIESDDDVIVIMDKKSHLDFFTGSDPLLKLVDESENFVLLVSDR